LHRRIVNYYNHCEPPAYPDSYSNSPSAIPGAKTVSIEAVGTRTQDPFFSTEDLCLPDMIVLHRDHRPLQASDVRWRVAKL
jgi:hypothetical protein